MHIELVETLRCPHPHEDTWLVAAVTRFDGRDIVSGTLGCPVCRRQFGIEAGEVDFATQSSGAGARSSDERDERAQPAPPDDEAGAVLRARALLALSDEATGLVLLGGRNGRVAAALADAARVATMLLNAPRWIRAQSPHLSAIRIDDTVPLAAGAVRAAWLDESTAIEPILLSTARALAPGARLVAPVQAAVPPGLVELARDDREWVAERPAGAGRAQDAQNAPVPLRRRQAGTPSS